MTLVVFTAGQRWWIHSTFSEPRAQCARRAARSRRPPLSLRTRMLRPTRARGSGRSRPPPPTTCGILCRLRRGGGQWQPLPTVSGRSAACASPTARSIASASRAQAPSMLRGCTWTGGLLAATGSALHSSGARLSSTSPSTVPSPPSASSCTGTAWQRLRESRAGSLPSPSSTPHAVWDLPSPTATCARPLRHLASHCLALARSSSTQCASAWPQQWVSPCATTSTQASAGAGTGASAGAEGGSPSVGMGRRALSWRRPKVRSSARPSLSARSALPSA
mmetsp:Transcript_13494/g.36011  ORF Transcript_13494/g.36011 Transcript_13494/m.36011 type:complete len:278 (+) Transcript_13494:2215-3048(+)